MASLSDGTTQDVTSDPGTSYLSVDPTVASPDPNGEMTFTRPAGEGNALALIVVTRGSFTRKVGFTVAP